MALAGLEEARVVRTPAFARIADTAALVVPRHEIALIHGPHSTGKRTALNTWLAGQELPVARLTLAGNESGRKLLQLLHDQVIAPDDLPERDLQDDLVEALAAQPRIVVVEHTERCTAEAAGQIEWLHGRPGQQAAWFLLGGPQAAKAIGRDPLLWDAICATVEVAPLTDEVLLRALRGMHDLFAGADTDLLTEIDTRVCHGVLGRWSRFLQHAIHLRDQAVALGRERPVLDRPFAKAVLASMPATVLKKR
ncbi:hypothetical protein JKP75_13255 [Blastococcus sp. TML/M2B]|uniref:hypothetical protein n=1 Tax=unclassified Blastococcus TaxID=2619396 RepID=UPI00190D052C|nr:MULTISPECIES: hypothetical protein [unclassified Blastococcus]MBN1093445.1 hypothetical protein [Blastococcus sp. TML/M2B]MBN1096438.1 hypothetical protein [Blastococcus sp. TML/C7B]